jgi:hypothetical protein
MVALAIASPATVEAQATPRWPGTMIPDTLFAIRLADGSSVIARVEDVRGDTVVLRLSGGGQLAVALEQIRSYRVASGQIVNGQYLAPDPNGTRLFFSSTARSLAAGEGFFGVYLFVMPFAGVGVTDRISIAAGAPLLLGEFQPIAVAPSIQLLSLPRAQVSAGAIALFWSEGDDQSFGLLYGVGTFGSRDHALTLGAGWGFAGADISSKPVLIAGAEMRIASRAKFLTENYVVIGDAGLISAGFRLFGERLSADFGAGAAVGGGDAFCCLPLINFSYALGGAR